MAQPIRPTRTGEVLVTRPAATVGHSGGAVIVHAFKANGTTPTLNTAEVVKNPNAALPPTGTADFVDSAES